MSSRVEPGYSSVFRKLEKRIDKNFSEQTEFLSKLIKARSANSYTPEESKSDMPIEAAASRLIYRTLKEFGLSPRNMGVSKLRPNVVCILGPDRFRKSLLLNGHMDTASPTDGWTVSPFSGLVKNGKLFGVGALDMKGSLSAYIYAVKALLAERIKFDGRLILEFVVDSIGASSHYGTEYLLKKGITAKAAILGKPGTGKLCIGHRGGYRFRITTIGESIHTGRGAWERKEKGRNAVLDMARVAVALQSMELPYKPARAFPGRIPVFTFPTKISGGKMMYMVPDRCVAEGDVYLMPGNSDCQARLWIEDCLREHCPDVVYELESLAYIPSVEIAKTEEIVERLLRNATEVLGVKPKVAGSGPWNEAWMLVTRDVPTVAGFGPDGENGHGIDEYVDLASLRNVTKIYARTITEYLGIKK